MENPATQQQWGETPNAAEHQAQYRLLAEMSPDLLARHTPQGAWLYVSPACRMLLGYEPTELLGRSWNDFSHPDDAPAMAKFQVAMLEEPSAGLVVHSVTHRVRRKDGCYVWIETLGRAIGGSDTGTLECQTSSRDVTRHKETEAENEKLIHRLQDALKEVDPITGVIAICSHCKKIRDGSGHWEQLEAYFHKYSNALFSHGICPDCARETFREFTDELGLDL